MRESIEKLRWHWYYLKYIPGCLAGALLIVLIEVDNIFHDLTSFQLAAAGFGLGLFLAWMWVGVSLTNYAEYYQVRRSILVKIVSFGHRPSRIMQVPYIGPINVPKALSLFWVVIFATHPHSNWYAFAAGITWIVVVLLGEYLLRTRCHPLREDEQTEA